mgnify:CR=1 FL=1|tara:strand:+ start:1996 stop:3411 length:1416 start_codon:yes stop_codon:yes gene_type:complete
MNDRYRTGYQPVPVPEVTTGGAIAQQSMASAAVGAKAGSVLGPGGAAIGAGLGAGVGLIAGKVKQKRSRIESDRASGINEDIDEAYDQSMGQMDMRRAYIAEDGATGSAVEDTDALVVEYEGTPGGGSEILGTPHFDADGNITKFTEKSEAPKVTHEMSDGKNPDNLIPTQKGKESGQLPDEIASKPAIEEGDVIIDTQEEKDYNYTKRLIQMTNQGNKSAAKELKNRIDKLPLEETENNEGMKKYNDGVRSVGSMLKYTGTANNLIRGQEKIEKLNRRFLKGKDQRYERDVANEERKILESRNAAAKRQEGRAMSAGQAQAYASNLQSKSDNATAEMEARERNAKRSIDAQNVTRQNMEAAKNLDLANKYDDINSQRTSRQDLYRDIGLEGVTQAAQVAERQDYQESRDKALDEKDQRMIDQGLFDTKNFRYNDKGSKFKGRYSEESSSNKANELIAKKRKENLKKRYGN